MEWGSLLFLESLGIKLLTSAVEGYCAPEVKRRIHLPSGDPTKHCQLRLARGCAESCRTSYTPSLPALPTAGSLLPSQCLQLLCATTVPCQAQQHYPLQQIWPTVKHSNTNYFVKLIISFSSVWNPITTCYWKQKLSPLSFYGHYLSFSS